MNIGSVTLIRVIFYLDKHLLVIGYNIYFVQIKFQYHFVLEITLRDLKINQPFDLKQNIKFRFVLKSLKR